jgi:superfamily I DNA/RNA helicase
MIKEVQMQEEEIPKHVFILKSLQEIPFPVGKKLLVDYVSGEGGNNSIESNELDILDTFGCLNMARFKIEDMLDKLIEEGFIEITSSKFNRFMKVLRLTIRGQNEIARPKWIYSYESEIVEIEQHSNKIHESEKVIFNEHEEFLNGFNEEQKKAIVSPSNKVLCIAGAGSGKTTVLTKRIEFLVKHKSVNPKKILAITFTRKAKDEMISRLSSLNVDGVWVETFNSFGEKVLNEYWREIYGRPFRLITYGEKIMAVREALNHLNLKVDDVLKEYFSERQRDSKTKDQLFNVFLNDCFFVIDYYKSRREEIKDFSEEADIKHKRSAKNMYLIARYLKNYLDSQGYRNYNDQIIDVVDFFKKNKDYISEFYHVLVDEYQDVNALQVELLELLNPLNSFVVGDPRQSIFGWRGSDISFVNTLRDSSDVDVIYLVKNYRSNNHIVKFMNSSIRKMGLPDLENLRSGEKSIYFENFEDESSEFDFVVKSILESNISREEIFVLARTNRQLVNFSERLKSYQIGFILKNEDIGINQDIEEGKITLATVHSIKGLEASMVFVIGAARNNFPCKATDHPILDLIKVEDYDKNEEEMRLFYVAISRAKDKLYISYSGKRPTKFITSEMIDIIDNGE